jgi:hypothetical protein
VTGRGDQYSLFEVELSPQVQSPAPIETAPVVQAPSTPQRFSDFVVYVDESGDHSLVSIDPDYPVFVLALCVFHKRHFAEHIMPAVGKLKFNYFGHDSVVLHEHEIRKQKGQFAFLSHLPTRQEFMARLNAIMDASNFVLIACVVDKARMPRAADTNPYHVALDICLDALRNFLAEKGQADRKTHLVVECRGPKEDRELELEFRRICDGANPANLTLPFDIVFADKRTNLVGLQLADLVARPVGIHHLRPQQRNQAFEVLQRKFFCAGGRARVGQDYENVGLMVYPPQKAKSPGEPTEAATPTGNPQST